jgi:hypothetical protein
MTATPYSEHGPFTFFIDTAHADNTIIHAGSFLRLTPVV